MWNYGKTWITNNCLLASFNNVPEKVINEFLSMNGGINVDKFITEFTAMWESFNEVEETLRA